jgi:hypothetical protein
MVQAERVPLSPEQQKAEATHIVKGVVKAVYSREVQTMLYGKGTVETHYLLEIEVQGVEKGAGIEKRRHRIRALLAAEETRRARSCAGSEWSFWHSPTG